MKKDLILILIALIIITIFTALKYFEISESDRTYNGTFVEGSDAVEHLYKTG
jgi:hypothetical protein